MNKAITTLKRVLMGMVIAGMATAFTGCLSVHHETEPAPTVIVVPNDHPAPNGHPNP